MSFFSSRLKADSILRGGVWVGAVIFSYLLQCNLRMNGFSSVKMTGEKSATPPWAWDVGFAPSAGEEVPLQQNHLRVQWDIREYRPERPGRFGGSLGS